MRHLQRQEEPEHLRKNKEAWLRRFLENRAEKPNCRPPASQYAHPNIRRVLMSISNTKCYYCEALLKDMPRDVEHLIEINHDPSKAFDWDNLYLSCKNCNTKMKEGEMSKDEVLNPFTHTDIEIGEALKFDGEEILPANNSEIGDKTIKKFRLNSEIQDNLRRKHLLFLHRRLLDIKEAMIERGDKVMSPEEKESLRDLMSEYKPYTLLTKSFFASRCIHL